jgi:hypothetical protein
MESTDLNEILIQHATVCHETALSANMYLALLVQFGENVRNFTDEMNISSCFYQTVYCALLGQLYIEIGKLYESNPKNYHLDSLSSLIHDNLQVFPRYVEISTVNSYFDKETHKFEVRNETEMRKLDPEEDYRLLVEKRRKLKKSIGSTYEQRCVKYAHNPRGLSEGFVALTGEFTRDTKMFRELIDYAFDLSEFVITYLTGVSPARIIDVEDDWTRTLKYVKVAIKAEATE